MIPTSVYCLRFNFFNVRSNVRVRVCVRVFKFSDIHSRMDRCLYPDGVFMSKEVHTDNTRQYLDRNRTDRQRAGSRQKKIRTDRHRTAFFLKIRTESRQLTKSRQIGPGQTDTGQLVFQKSGQNPDSGQNRDRQNPDRQTPDRKS